MRGGLEEDKIAGLELVLGDGGAFGPLDVGGAAQLDTGVLPGDHNQARAVVGLGPAEPHWYGLPSWVSAHWAAMTPRVSPLV